MNGINWIKKETNRDVIGSYALQTLINQLASTYKTNTVVSKINQNNQSQDDRYCVDVWFNADSGCYIINAYRQYVLDD